VRLHLLRTDRFTTSFCRVVLHRDLGSEATATAILGQILQSATARHPTREALGHRLADLYGAALSVGVSKLGDRQILNASLEWPTDHIPRARGVLADGLSLLRGVWSEPVCEQVGGEAVLSPELVETEQRNHLRMLASRRNDKGRHAMRRLIAALCAGEPHGLDAQGREQDVPAATPARLRALHGRLLARAPIDVFLTGDLTPADAVRAVRTHLLWPGRAARPMRVPPVSSVRPPRARPRHLVEHDRIVQGKLVFGYRAPVKPTAKAAFAAETLAGVLGGGSYGRLFKVVREVHGLCYYASAAWQRAKGLMFIQTGIDAANERRVRRLVAALTREGAAGELEASSLAAFRQDAAHRVAALADSPRAMVGWHLTALTLGLDPSPRAWLRSLEAVRPADVNRLGRRLRLDTTFLLAPKAR
jgi:predicted Zn-dependent peptidase